METTMPTIRGLFDSPRVYLIPNYQRNYVWNEFDQWEPLWLDVVNIAETLIQPPPAYHQDPPKPHFLGATVLKEITRPGANVRSFVVIDGQQRLTTLQLFLTAVGNSFVEHAELSALLATVRSFTINWISGQMSGEEPNKIKPLAGDFLPFNEIMEASRNGAEMPPGGGRMGNCYRFFSRKVSDWLLAPGNSGQQVEDRAKYLLTALSDQLQVVAIWLHQGENESAIFEALNARGEPLSEWEKVKNLILAKAGESPQVDQGRLYENLLSDFDAEKWRNLIGSGANSRRISDLFLDYWLESKIKRPVEARRVYREFRVELDKPENSANLEAWCSEIKQDGERFLHWERNPLSDGDVESIFHNRRRMLGIGAIWPLLLALSRIEMSDADRNRCLRALDSFMVRRAIAGKRANSFPEITLATLNALPQHPSGEMPYSDAVINHLATYESNSTYWPGDAGDSGIRWRILDEGARCARLLLETVERAIMRGKYAGNRTLQGGLPVEHLMPQDHSNLEHWPLPVNPDENPEGAEVARDARKAIIHRLGNLTLVQPGLNSILSNKPWVEKRRILAEQDNLYINKDLLNHAPDDHWDEEQIRLRGERLVDYILQIWPHGHAVTGEIERIQT